MIDFLFYTFTAIMLMSAMGVVLNRGPINSVICMILALVSQAALFVLLEAYFIAAIQIIVYAGAVMVLFLFVVMLLKIDSTKLKLSLPNIFCSALAFLILLSGVLYLAYNKQHLPETLYLPLNEATTILEINPFPYSGSIQSFGYSIFTQYLLPFEIAGFILLIAMIGVVVISKHFKGNDPETTPCTPDHSENS